VEVEIIGPLASSLGARSFSRGVIDLLARYASVIATHGLCPYSDAGLGEVVVVLDDRLDVELAVARIRASGARVLHLVFPCAPRERSHPFERFCSTVATRVADRGSVHAAFHPAMTGENDDPDRRVGLVRRAPDPFLQLVPGELAAAHRPLGDVARVLAELAELHAARARLVLGAAA
jgi:hypothetical protein